MTLAFADTFYYLALHNPADAAHEAARAFSATFRGTLVTTWAVLLEIGDALCRRENRRQGGEILALVRADPATVVVPLTEGLLTRGLDLYGDRPDKGWSLTDCISFETMAEFQLTDALTGDRHFQQAGFRCHLIPE